MNRTHWALMTTIVAATLNTTQAANASVSLTSQITHAGKNYRLHQGEQILYQAEVVWSAESIKLQVEKGHPSQIGSLLITDQSVTASDSEERILWTAERGQLPLCLPELFPEFAKAHMDELKKGETIQCLGPVLKAEKLAPFEFSMKALGTDSMTIEVGPGSLGMWFFMDALEFDINLTATHMTRFNGLSPAPEQPQGPMRYLQVDHHRPSEYIIANIDKALFYIKQ